MFTMMVCLLGVLLLVFIICACWFIYDSATRRDDEGCRCDACLQDGLCFCKDK